MTFDAIRDYCLAMRGSGEYLPFGDDVLAFRVRGKLFALLHLERLPQSINLKCDPERAVELRERHEAIQPGYHMNKKHWNTLILDGRLPTDLVRDLIDHSYDLVVAGLKKADREALAAEG